MTHTTDPSDPRLGHGTDAAPVPQNDAYLVLCARIHQDLGVFIITGEVPTS